MFPLKAAAKVQLLFILTSFFKKISFFFFALQISFNSLRIANRLLLTSPPSSQLGWQRYYLLPLSSKLFFTYFF